MESGSGPGLGGGGGGVGGGCGLGRIVLRDFSLLGFQEEGDCRFLVQWLVSRETESCRVAPAPGALLSDSIWRMKEIKVPSTENPELPKVPMVKKLDI